MMLEYLKMCRYV
jgi:hypothetical protein